MLKVKIPKFDSIEYENFSKNYQTQINEKIWKKNKWNLLPDSIKINSSADQFRTDLECFFWENIAERYEIEPD